MVGLPLHQLVAIFEWLLKIGALGLDRPILNPVKRELSPARGVGVPASDSGGFELSWLQFNNLLMLDKFTCMDYK